MKYYVYSVSTYNYTMYHVTGGLEKNPKINKPGGDAYLAT